MTLNVNDDEFVGECLREMIAQLKSIENRLTTLEVRMIGVEKTNDRLILSSEDLKINYHQTIGAIRFASFLTLIVATLIAGLGSVWISQPHPSNNPLQKHDTQKSSP